VADRPTFYERLKTEVFTDPDGRDFNWNAANDPASGAMTAQQILDRNNVVDTTNEFAASIAGVELWTLTDKSEFRNLGADATERRSKQDWWNNFCLGDGYDRETVRDRTEEIFGAGVTLDAMTAQLQAQVTRWKFLELADMTVERVQNVLDGSV
jgi:hypothetical protein